MPSLLPFPASPEPAAKISAAPGVGTAPRSQTNQAEDAPSFDDVLDSQVEASEDEAGPVVEDDASDALEKQVSPELLLPAGIALTSPQALLIVPPVPLPVDPSQITSPEDVDGLPVALPSVCAPVQPQLISSAVAAKPAEALGDPTQASAVQQPNGVESPAHTEITSTAKGENAVEIPAGMKLEQSPSLSTGPMVNAAVQTTVDSSVPGKPDLPKEVGVQPLAPDIHPTEVPSAVPTAAPAPIAQSNPKAPVVTAVPSPAAQEIAAAVTVQASPNQEVKGIAAAPVVKPTASKEITSEVAGENSAATQIPTSVQGASGELSLSSKKKETSLTAVGKQVKKHYEAVGTDAAKQGESTMFSFRQIFEAPLARVAELGSVGTQAASAELELPAPAGVVGQAVQAVKDIREVGEGLGLAPRPAVELKFDFSAHERLTVKVELRDGVIQTTFRTNSDDVRNAVAEAWAGQAVNPESKQKFADPVFVSAPTRDTNSGFDFAGNSNRQQRSGEQENSGRSHSRLSFDSGPAAPAVSAPVPHAVVASDRKLRAFA